MTTVLCPKAWPLAATVLTLMLTACGGDEAAGKKGVRPPATVEVQPVRAAMLASSLSAIGTLRANESLSVRPEVAGRVTAIGFREGAPVTAGQLLIQLDDAQARADLAQAVASRDLAASDLRRAAELLPQSLIARNEYERLQAQAAIQQAAVARAQALLRKTRILAPFSGVAGLRQFSPGELVQPGQALVTVVSLSPVKLDVPVPESQSSQIRTGQAVSAVIPALSGLVAEGRVLALEPGLDGDARALRARITLDNPGGRLQPGMTARVSFAVGRPRSALLVPDQAVVPQGGRQVVYVVRDDMATATPVIVGERQGGSAEVLSGLQAGDVVVVSGQNKLPKPTQKIRPVPYDTVPDGLPGRAPGPQPASPPVAER